MLKAMLSRCLNLCAGLKDPRHFSVLQAVAVSSCRHLSNLPFTMASWNCTQQLSDSVVFLISIAPCTCHARKHLLYNSIVSIQTPALHHIPTNTYFTIPSYQHKHVPYNAIRSQQTPAFQLYNNSPKRFFQLFVLFYKYETERGPERSCRISNAN